MAGFRRSIGPAFWRRDGKELYFLARDRSVMVADVSTAPSFSFTKPRVLFRQAAVPEARQSAPMANASLSSRRLADRSFSSSRSSIAGEVLQKVGEPGLYSQPSFSPDGTRLLVVKNDLQSAQADYWTIELATGKHTRLTNDSFGKAPAVVA